ASDLRTAFESFGRIKDIYVPLDYYTKVSRGFGYVEYYDRADAEAAYDRRNEVMVLGRPVVVEFARGQRKKTPIAAGAAAAAAAAALVATAIETAVAIVAGLRHRGRTDRGARDTRGPAAVGVEEADAIRTLEKQRLKK
ncbi:hypothetical protein LPJ72_000671, partial [Coemansia sp. Benny D160-2]